MEKIAVITIATGKYNSLFANFKSKLLHNFLPNKHTDIFLFTDDLSINHNSLIYIPHLPWPLCTLLRFHHINKHKERFKDYKYIYYLDVDMIADSLIGDDVLPINDEIVCVSHYWNYDSYESYENTNSKSTAYIECDKNIKYHYCQACFFGSTNKSFLTMSVELENNINVDLKNNIIAKWHDESHLNKYIMSHPFRSLHSSYAHPSNFQRDKNAIKFIHMNANAWGLNQ